MLFNALLAAGALALHTSAFLIPLEVSREAGITQAKELTHQVLELDCPGCPVASDAGDLSVWTKSDETVSIVRAP
jgi:hypothetical protein